MEVKKIFLYLLMWNTMENKDISIFFNSLRNKGCIPLKILFRGSYCTYIRIYKLEGILMLEGDLKSASNLKDFFFMKFVFCKILYLKAELQFKFINFDQ